jgi:hypothetical protein
VGTSRFAAGCLRPSFSKQASLFGLAAHEKRCYKMGVSKKWIDSSVALGSHDNAMQFVWNIYSMPTLAAHDANDTKE